MQCAVRLFVKDTIFTSVIVEVFYAGPGLCETYLYDIVDVLSGMDDLAVHMKCIVIMR